MTEEKLLDGVMTYEAITDNVRVRVQAYYMQGESKPSESQFFWAYRIEITNHGSDTVQLLNRHWIITDGMGRREEVKGAGVIGEQPILSTGEDFTYTSGCPLATSSGFMVGTFEMVRLSGDKAGETFMIDVPAFSLDSPDNAPHISQSVN